MLPPLKTGDRLSRGEFEWRYEAMPHLKKAELIEGVVYVPLATGRLSLSQARAHLIGWLGRYEGATPGTEGGAHCTVRLDPSNESQPDVVLLVQAKHEGQTNIDEDDFIQGAPELMADVIDEGAHEFLAPKLNAYRRNGVREYIVWHVPTQEVDWFVLREGQYERLMPDAEGLLRSESFPGLWLNPAALIRGDMARVQAVVRQGIASQEHTAFVARLNPWATPGLG